jgi:hypothetical protein
LCKEIPKVHSCATWALEKLRNLDDPEINKDITSGLLMGLIDKLAHVPSFHTGGKTEAFRAAQAVPTEALIQASEPVVEGTSLCIEKMKYGAEDTKIGVLVGGSTGSVAGAVAVTSCCTRKPRKDIGVATVLGSTAIGVTTAVVG